MKLFSTLLNVVCASFALFAVVHAVNQQHEGEAESHPNTLNSIRRAISALTPEEATRLLSSLKDIAGPSHSFHRDTGATAAPTDVQHRHDHCDLITASVEAHNTELKRVHMLEPSGGAAECADDYTVVDYSETLEGDGLSSLDPAFIELAEPSPDPSLPLNCVCKPHACDCDKRCYCRIRTLPYVGARMSPPEMGSLSGMSPEHSCQCNLAEVGGNGFNPGNTIDCDCKVAKCKCTQQCTCPSEPAH